LRVGDRVRAEEFLAEYREQAMDSRQGIVANNSLLLDAALAIAEGRFADGKRLAAQASDHGGRHNTVVALAYGAQILAARLEQGRVGEVIAAIHQLDAVLNDLPAWRAMLAGALADAGDHAQAAAELDRLLSEGDVPLPHDVTVPLAVRYLPEACRQLGDVAAAQTLLPHIAPWAGQLLVVTIGTSIEGASDRSIGHLLTTLGRFDEADAAYESASRLERGAGFRPLAARTDYWHARALLEREAIGDRQRSVELLTDVVTVTDELGMRLLREQAAALLKTL
jgi:tetratricopeptide (TPR) repeat protein